MLRPISLISPGFWAVASFGREVEPGGTADDSAGGVEPATGECELGGVASHRRGTLAQPDPLTAVLLRYREDDRGGPCARDVRGPPVEALDTRGSHSPIEMSHTLS